MLWRFCARNGSQGVFFFLLSSYHSRGLHPSGCGERDPKRSLFLSSPIHAEGLFAGHFSSARLPLPAI